MRCARKIATPPPDGVTEFLVFKDRIYLRDCDDENTGCKAWKDDEAHFLWYPLTAPGWFMPEHPLFVASRAEKITEISHPDGNASGERRLRGHVDYLRTIVDSAREFREQNLDVPGFEEAEEELPADDEFEASASNPVPVDIVIGEDDMLIHRISMFLPREESDDFRTLYEVQIIFSHFDAISVDRPN